MWGTVLLVAAAVLLLVFALFGTRFTFPTDLPSPAGLPIFGHSFMVDIDNNAQSLAKMVSGGAPLTRVWLFGTEFLILGKASVAKEMLMKRALPKNKPLRALQHVFGEGDVLTSHGEIWSTLRKTMNAAFTPGSLRGFMPIVHRSAGILAERAEAALAAGGTFHAEKEAGAFTSTLIGSACLDNDMDYSVEIDMDQHPFMRAFNELALISNELMFTPFKRFWPPLRARMRSSQAVMNRYILDGMDSAVARAGAGKPKPILLDMLLAAEHPDSGRKLSREQVRINIGILLAAGHETTTHCLSFTLYLLAKHQAWQDAVVAEAVAVLDGDELLPYDKLTKLDVMTRCIMESLRMFPVGVGSGRTLPAGFTLAGYTLPRQAEAFIPMHLLHLDEETWEQPSRFNPDRFTKEAKSARDRFSYIPFSLGPRDCLGKNLAWLELRIMLSTLLTRYRFHLVDGYAYKVRQAVTLRPFGTMPLRIERRE
eukprot:PLAT4399.1.p2 GENE.PLAT4399.1~~PLAT4399.1.p2  ORF type:complete len:481 (+),score=196.41 PLAT4399.1:9-1451(+)